MSSKLGTKAQRIYPKGCFPLWGGTIIERQIELYQKCGIDNIIVVRGFAADKIQYEGIRYYTNEDYANTNMVESLMAVKVNLMTASF